MQPFLSQINMRARQSIENIDIETGDIDCNEYMPSIGLQDLTGLKTFNVSVYVTPKLAEMVPLTPKPWLGCCVHSLTKTCISSSAKTAL